MFGVFRLESQRLAVFASLDDFFSEWIAIVAKRFIWSSIDG